ncbi:MAG: hypothetical protein N3A62_04580 [Thermodesulfovibrionales bacterium]|nr:hypothetical protein [Thermodesulfovibrionales bacterium]
MKILRFFVLLLLVVVISCSTSTVRYTHEELRGFPPDIQQKIIKGEISTGMTPQQVRYSWHAPKNVKTTQTKDGKVVEEWTYSYMGACPVTLYFSDAKLQSIILTDASKTSEIRYTKEEIKAYPPDIQQMIINAQVSTDMTPSQVRNSWGSPEGVSSYKVGEKNVEEWIYTSSALCRLSLIFSEGKVSGIVRSEGFSSR